MLHLLEKRAKMSIGGAQQKLPQYLNKIHYSIAKSGSKQDAMIFEKTIQMQAKTSNTMKDLMDQMKHKRGEKSEELKAMSKELMEIIAEMN